MDKFTVYIKKFKLAVAILAITLVVFILLIVKVVPVFQSIMEIQNQTTTQSGSLSDTERKLATLQEAAKKKAADDALVLKAFFKPIETGLGTEAVISDEFGEILELVRENQIKTRSVKYDYDPQDDNFVKNVGNKYSVCRLNIEMVASYANLENFLRDLYKHEHFLDISSIEIAPYSKNKRILLINLQIKLYAQKDPSTVTEAAPTPTQPEGSAGSLQPSMNPDGIVTPGTPPPSGSSKEVVSEEEAMRARGNAPVEQAIMGGG